MVEGVQIPSPACAPMSRVKICAPSHFFRYRQHEACPEYASSGSEQTQLLDLLASAAQTHAYADQPHGPSAAGVGARQQEVKPSSVAPTPTCSTVVWVKSWNFSFTNGLPGR